MVAIAFALAAGSVASLAFGIDSFVETRMVGPDRSRNPCVAGGPRIALNASRARYGERTLGR